MQAETFLAVGAKYKCEVLNPGNIYIESNRVEAKTGPTNNAEQKVVFFFFFKENKINGAC